MCYSLLGGIAVFADTSGLHYSLPSLTLHSYLWHILLILLGIFSGTVCIKSFGNRSALRAFAGSTGLYLLCCLAAEIINLSFDRLGTINMFYINPDYRMQQIIFHDLSFLIGNLPAIFLYIAATILGAFLLFLAWMLFARFFKH